MSRRTLARTLCASAALAVVLAGPAASQESAVEDRQGAAGCRTGTAEAGAVARQLLEDNSAAGGAAVATRLALADCLADGGDGSLVRALLLSARDTIAGTPPGAQRDAMAVQLAEMAGLRGLLAPPEVMALATFAGTPEAEGAIMRAWASDVLRWNNHPQATLAGPELVDASAVATADGKLYDALLLAAAAEVATAGRPAALAAVGEAAASAGDAAVGRLAARATGDAEVRQTVLDQLAERALALGLPADAHYAARLMAPTPAALSTWLQIADAHADAGYPIPGQQALESALRLGRAHRAEDAGRGLMLVAASAAALGDPDLATGLLAELPEAPGRTRAVAAIVRYLAESGRLPEAGEWALQLEDLSIDAPIRSEGISALAAALAADGGLQAALDLLARHPDLSGPAHDAALAAVAVALAEGGEDDQARGTVARIVDASSRAEAERRLAAIEGTEAVLAVVALQEEAALADPNPQRRAAAIARLADALAAVEALPALEALREQLALRHPSDGLSAIDAAIAVTLGSGGRLDEAITVLGAIEDPAARDAARARLGEILARSGAIEPSVRVVRSISDADLRLTAFRLVAEIQAHRLDVHGLVPSVYNQPSPVADAAGGPAAGDAAAGRRPAAVAERAGIAMFDLTGAPPDDWPVLTGLTDRAAAASVVPADVRAHVLVGDSRPVVRREPMTTNPYNEKFIEIVPLLDYAQRQGEPTPHLIHLPSGTATLSQVREALLGIGRDDYLQVRNGVYLLQRPLIVGPDATLVVSGADTRELRMSTDHYAYMVSGGTVVFADTSVTSWDIQAEAPSEIVLDQTEFQFRPFFTAWSASDTYAARTRFRALGYNNRKSWGMTVSSGPQDFTHEGLSVMESPYMLLVENLFDRMYYGFYSYHSHNIDIVGNEYRNNVIYGPDPHDYSDSILMALNTSYGVDKKHGLIVSREVSGIFIGNIAFDNHGAGIMLDRLANHSIIYANTAFDNGHDGIAVYETACSIVANNRASDNTHSGLRIRNSVDIGVFDNEFADNDLEGVLAYTDPLAEHFWRNLVLDPFWTIVTASLSGNRITGNGGALRFEDTLAVSLARNEIVGNGDRLLAGDFMPAVAMLTRTYRLDRDSVMLADLCQLPAERYADCAFREAGIFDFDGQEDWQLGELPEQDCAAAFVVSSDGLARESRL